MLHLSSKEAGLTFPSVSVANHEDSCVINDKDMRVQIVLTTES